jgi:hypothetical protein
MDMKLLLPQKTAGYSATVLPDGRWLLYHAADNTAITLTAPAGIFWELCDGKTPLAEIIQQLQEIYPDTPLSTLETEACALLPILIEQGLIVADAS